MKTQINHMAVERPNLYIKTTLADVYAAINDCPCEDATTIKLLNIIERLTYVVDTIAKEAKLI